MNTPLAQYEVERSARDPDRQGAPPAFLAGSGNVAQTTLEQQAARSQALAVEQLRALMNAYGAVCQGTRC